MKNNEWKYTSLELSKKIAEAYKKASIEAPESEWWWEGQTDMKTFELTNRYWISPQMAYPAYDCAELGEMLPGRIKRYALECYKDTTFTFKDWMINYIIARDIFHCTCDGTEAEARGKMLLWLIENGYIQQ